MNALVSICVPAYKAEKYLLETLESVRRQSFTDWELIVTEDGSRDSTQSIVESFAATVPQKVVYTRHDPNRGLSATRNAGFEHSQGEYIALLDSDDIWMPNHLGKCVALLDESDVGVAFGGSRLFDSDTNETLEFRIAPPGSMDRFASALMEGQIIIQPSSAVFRRSLLKTAGGFNPQFPICNDLEFWIRAAKTGARFAYAEEVTCDYRKHESALSKRGRELVMEVAEIHALHRNWELVPRADRKRQIGQHFHSAFKMNLRKQPLQALRFYARGMFFKLSI